jgi:glucose/arabinose dehydrogenase
MVRIARGGVALLLAAAITGCAERSRVPPGADVGPKPTLSEPRPGWLPTVSIAPAAGWEDGTKPLAAPGLDVQALATGLSHPRWLAVLPNGDVLVAESNAPERPDAGKGIKGWVMKHVMRRAGAGVPSANRITLLRDTDGDGRAEVRSAFLENLNSPFGMTLVGDRLYVANTDAVVEYPYVEGTVRIEAAGKALATLPGGTLNHHWTKNVLASPDGRYLYATVGSNSNVAENGLAAEEGRAAIWQIERESGRKRLFATGLRNPNGLAFTRDGVLWTVVNERDELGSDLVPDYLTSVRDGGFYGWPWSYYGPHVDTRIDPRPDMVARAIVPDYALGSHVAPLGLAALPPGPLARALGQDGPPPPALGAPAAGTSGAGTPAPAAPASAPGAAGAPTLGMFVGLHGSWNRRPLSGYRVVFVPFRDERPQGEPLDVLTGFVDAEGRARGRPVGVAIDRRGALLVADDVGNTVWRVTPQ